jgi:hypothetical protein
LLGNVALNVVIVECYILKSPTEDPNSCFWHISRWRQ